MKRTVGWIQAVSKLTLLLTDAIQSAGILPFFDSGYTLQQDWQVNYI